MAADETPVDTNPITTADKRYYASRSGTSALGDANRYAPNRRGRPGQPIQIRQAPASAMKTESADKYYRGHDETNPNIPHQIIEVPISRGRTVRVEERETAARPAAGKSYDRGTQESLAGIVRPMIVTHDDQVANAAAHVAKLLADGQTAVLIQVGDDRIEQKVRTSLELRVSREEITEDQYREVRFSLAPKDNSDLADQMFGRVNSTNVPLADDNDPLPADFAAFVKGDRAEIEQRAAQGFSPTEPAGAVSVSNMEESRLEAEHAEPVKPGNDAVVNFGAVKPNDDDQD